MSQILYIANMRLPSERAHSVHVMEMCAAFGNMPQTSVVLFFPRRNTHIQVRDIYAYYGVANNFVNKSIFTIDLFRFSVVPRRIAYYLNAVVFALGAWWRARKLPDHIIISRDLLSAWLFAITGRRVAFEVHDLPGINLVGLWVLRQIPYIITTNDLKKDRLVQDFGINAKNILVAPNAVNAYTFLSRVGGVASEDMVALGWPLSKQTVLYTGSLLPWKGVETLVRSARFLPDKMTVVIVGGGDSDRKRLQELVVLEGLARQVVFIPHQPHSKVSGFFGAADVLVLPTSAKTNIGREETSPLKVFEYLSAGKPIVASDVPSSREILDETTAIFFSPDSPEDCARAIVRCINMESAEREHMRAAQLEFVRAHTWNARAKAILDFFSV